MKIVIDIPESKIKDPSSIDLFYMVGAIKNGIPLPKGHGRLIDADALGEELHRYTEAPYLYALKVFNDAPTIIEADKELEQPDKCKFFKDADCCYPIEDCNNCPNRK
jgi:hypothetical protein